MAVWRGRLSTFDNDDHDEILWPGDDLVQCKPAKHDISSFLSKRQIRTCSEIFGVLL